MTRINLHHSIIPNINGFGSSIKRHRLEDLTRKQEYSFYCFKESHLTSKTGERMEKGVQTNGTKKQTGLDIVILDKTDFKPNLVRRDQNHFILN